jgi:hypothetical protein
MRRSSIAAVVAALMAQSTAWAAPPPPDSEDGRLMAPYAGFIATVHGPNPTGIPLAWWLSGVVRCFLPPPTDGY